MSSGRERALKACKTVQALGIPTSTTKKVLKRLLGVYDNKWEYIEADNYQVLVDAIFDAEEAQDGNTGDQPIVDDAGTSKNDVGGSENCHSHGTKIRERQDEYHLPNPELSRENLLKRPKLEDENLPDIQHQQRNDVLASISGNSGSMIEPAEPQPSFKEKASQQQSVKGKTTPYSSERTGKIATYVDRNSSNSMLNTQLLQVEPVQLDIRGKDKGPSDQTTGNSFTSKEIGMRFQQRNRMVHSSSTKDKNVVLDDDSPTFETPLGMICTSDPFSTGDRAVHEYTNQGDTLNISSTFKANGNRSSVLHCKSRMNGKGTPQDNPCKRKASSIVADQKPTSIIDVASSESGEIKLSFSYIPDKAGFHVPDIEKVYKKVEDTCLKSYRILQPSFSFGKVMRELCQSFLELGAEFPEDTHENTVNIVPRLESLKRSNLSDTFGRIPASPGDLSWPAGTQSSGITIRRDHSSRQKAHENNVSRETKKNKELGTESSKSMPGNMVVVQKPQITLGETKPPHDVNDISKGEEKVRISIANDITSEKYPPFFNYIPHNIVHQNAYINVSLARIGDDDYCAECYNDCLAAPIPCTCARETGGIFAYTFGGIMRKELLDEYLSMNYESQKDRLFYCKECPLERSNNESMPEACKGHLIRKFVKECWSKCGCSKQCGNRVVQRGITYNLQVFYTSAGKGWGLRTLDELPRGAFVCEYVGEVLTNTELYDRTIKATGRARHTYPVLLDADWGSEGSLKDEEALCLDATFYGNVARFINHRCVDANLIGIPVEVETPDRHYYHLAFFTTRKVEPLEELTWDYGIDFDDHEHPIKAFKCNCGSQVCRDVKRSRKKSRLKPLVSR